MQEMLKGAMAPLSSARSAFHGRRSALLGDPSLQRRSYRKNLKCRAVAEVSADQEALEKRGEQTGAGAGGRVGGAGERLESVQAPRGGGWQAAFCALYL